MDSDIQLEKLDSVGLYGYHSRVSDDLIVDNMAIQLRHGDPHSRRVVAGKNGHLQVVSARGQQTFDCRAGNVCGAVAAGVGDPL